MKVLHIIPALGNVYGGPSKSVLELVETIVDLGVSCDLVTTNANGNQILDVPLQTWIINKCCRIQYFPYCDVFDYKLTWSLSKWLFQHVSDYDLVHTNAIFSYPVLPAYWSCQWQGVPYVITPHGMLEPWALAYKSWKKQLYLKLLEKPAFKNASALQVLAPSEAEKIKPLGIKTPFVYIPNGINPNEFDVSVDVELFYQKFPETRNKKLILFLGRIDPKKGLDLLASAFARVCEQFPQTHLIIAGPDNIGFLSTAQNYFQRMGCSQAITFTGMLTGSLKHSALAAADIFVAPSYSEGFSISVLEGMISGLPCVITTGCNFPEAAMVEAAYVVEPDAERIAEALINCLQNPKQAQAIGNRARQLILDKYTWKRIASNLIEVYSTIVQKKSLSTIASLTV